MRGRFERRRLLPGGDLVALSPVKTTGPVRSRAHAARLSRIAGLALALLAARPAGAVVSAGTTGYDGLDIAQILGAGAWYGQGYTGSRSVVANIEAGAVWNGHVTLTHVTTYFKGPGVTSAPTDLFPPDTPDYDQHATFVGHVLAGRESPGGPGPAVQRGMAYGAELWSGAIATVQSPGGFGTTFNSVVDTYQMAMLDGVGGRTADVVNSSWGGGGNNSAGNSTRARALDHLVYTTGKVVVFAAGNGGPSAGSVLDPAIMKNDIVVGAMSNPDGPTPYDLLAAFSARGPQSYALPISALSALILPGVRAPVDLVAPGTDFTLARYGGASGANAGQGNHDLTPDGYALFRSGTSYAAPTVAGMASLMVDAAKDRGLAHGTDGRVIRAVLMNSADKPAGWTNNAAINPEGVLTTTQGVDWAMGAGRVNMARAAEEFLNGTTDLPGLVGGSVQPAGWDFGLSSALADNEYTFGAPLLAGSVFTATLTWWADEGFDTSTRAESSVRFGNQDDLDLLLYRVGESGERTLVAQSSTKYNLTEHLFLSIPSTGSYLLAVRFVGVVYDFLGGPESEAYALAWNASIVPAPGAALVLTAMVLAPRRRRR